jgi:hypothetical protein
VRYRVERGWILINGTRQDDGTIKPGTGGELRFMPVRGGVAAGGRRDHMGRDPQDAGTTAPRSGAGKAGDGTMASRDESEPTPSARAPVRQVAPVLDRLAGPAVDRPAVRAATPTLRTRSGT